MSTANPFERPPASENAPDSRIAHEVELLLKTGVEVSPQAAEERARAKKHLLDLEYKEEFGNIAEQLVEAALMKTLGENRIVDAPHTVDLGKPRTDENPLGKGQADFFFVPAPGQRGTVAVQMFARKLDPLRPEPTSPAHFRAEKEGRVAEQGFVQNADGSITPLALFEPDARIIDRAVSEWEGRGREGSPADYLSKSERARLTAGFVAEVRRSLTQQIGKHPYVHELPLQRACTVAIARIDAFIREELTKTKAGGPGLTSRPPAAEKRARSRAQRSHQDAARAG